MTSLKSTPHLPAPAKLPRSPALSLVSWLQGRAQGCKKQVARYHNRCLLRGAVNRASLHHDFRPATSTPLARGESGGTPPLRRDSARAGKAPNPTMDPQASLFPPSGETGPADPAVQEPRIQQPSSPAPILLPPTWPP